jgi:hypothetical protein
LGVAGNEPFRPLQIPQLRRSLSSKSRLAKQAAAAASPIDLPVALLVLCDVGQIGGFRIVDCITISGSYHIAR